MDAMFLPEPAARHAEVGALPPPNTAEHRLVRLRATVNHRAAMPGARALAHTPALD